MCISSPDSFWWVKSNVRKASAPPNKMHQQPLNQQQGDWLVKDKNFLEIEIEQQINKTKPETDK